MNADLAWEMAMARTRAELAGQRAAMRALPWLLLGYVIGGWLRRSADNKYSVNLDRDSE